MAFEIRKGHKLLDRFEAEATDFVFEQVTEYFEVEMIEDLTLEQVEELVASYNDAPDDMVTLGLKNVIDIWQCEHDEWLL